PEGSDRTEAEATVEATAAAAVADVVAVGSAGSTHAAANLRLEVRPAPALTARPGEDRSAVLDPRGPAPAAAEATPLGAHGAYSELERRGRFQLGAGNYDRAIADFVEVARLHPDATAYKDLGL